MDWEEALNLIEKSGPDRVGIDVGSRATKIAFTSNRGIVTSMRDTFDILYSGGGLKIPGEVVATGYGKELIRGARTIPEIRAHVVGSVIETGLETFTLLDIGGQDFKVTRVENGGIRDFFMNDKCAAGTGRFLEKMADMLSMTVIELGSFEGDIRLIESTCTVFTESEIISMMAMGRSREELARAVIRSVYERLEPLLRRFPLDRIIFTGGVSQCGGVGRTIQNELEVEIVIPKRAQYTGAIGCLHSRR